MWKAIKSVGLGISKRLFLFDLVGRSEWRRARLCILCYHGVSLEDEHEWDPRFYVSPQVLEGRFQRLRENGSRVLPLDEGVRRLYEGTLPPKSVAITFDDGLCDFYRQAYPLLKKYELPATVYLTTFYCYHPKPVFGMFCHYLMWKGRNSFRGDRLLDLKFTPDLTSEFGRMKAAGAIVASAEARGLSLTEKDALAEELARQLGVDYEAVVGTRILQLMKPEEVAELAGEGIDIQLHTHRHRAPFDHALFTREIQDNRHSIREMTGDDARAVHFCYPGGIHTPEFLPWLAEQGIDSATTCESGLASVKDHRLLLPRVVDTYGLTPIEWESWVVGVAELGNRVRRPWRGVGWSTTLG